MEPFEVQFDNRKSAKPRETEAIRISPTASDNWGGSLQTAGSSEQTGLQIPVFMTAGYG